MSEFEKYIRQGEPQQVEKARIWQTAIGLQDVDGLKTSLYLQETAGRHIEGVITIDEVRSLIDSYYDSSSGLFQLFLIIIPFERPAVEDKNHDRVHSILRIN